MKRNSCYLVVAALTAASLSFQSCDFFKKSGAGVDSTDVANVALAGDSLEFCTVLYEDTLTVGESLIQQSIKVDFPIPEAEGVLADSIREYLEQAIIQRRFPQFGEEVAEDESFFYEKGEEQAFVNTCASAGMSHMVASVNSAAEEGWNANFENDYNASMAYQTGKFVTFDESYSIYTGGAHGLYISWGTTFRKSDGKKMGWEIFDMSKKEQLIALIKRELRSYFAFQPENDPISEEELMEQLQVFDDPDTPENELEFGIPLPKYAPSVTREGIAFVYQQYEIAAYACGLPSGIFSIEQVKELLSDEGRELLGL